MKKIAKEVVKHKILITVLAFLLLIPSLIGIHKTKINYDILVYLPNDIKTIEGQKILKEDFHIGAFAFIVLKDQENQDVISLKEDILKIDTVGTVLSGVDALGYLPSSILPDDISHYFEVDNSKLMLVTFSESTSDEATLNAIGDIREVLDDKAEIGGISAMVLDTMELSNKEIFSYILIAVIFCTIVLLFATDSYLIPILLLGNIGIAILYNMGTNVLLGDISYITKAISAVLQLGVTTDFSIFLYHKYEQKKEKYEKEEAMSEAICETFKSVIGSSLTTIAGFLALCSMELTLGKDIGIVMAKGVLFGLISVLTIFPSFLLTFDFLIQKTKHKVLFPSFKKLQKFSLKHYILIFTCFLILLIPAWYGNKNVDVYYNLNKSLPDTLPSSIANETLKEKYNLVSPEMVLLRSDLKTNELSSLVAELKEVEGVSLVLSLKDITKDIPNFMLPEEIQTLVDSNGYQLIIFNSDYDLATDKLNKQISVIGDLVEKYDKDAIVAGEGPLMKDLIRISDKDIKNVNFTSIIVIFILMLLTLKSVSLPVFLVCLIEGAIFMNMSISYYNGATLPFVASIVIGTIQLGATIDYAILMSTTYLDERCKNVKVKAIESTLSKTVPSIIVSACCFFAATIGVGLLSKIDMIGAICLLLARGSIISMLFVVLVLPSILLIFDKFILKTTHKEGLKMKKLGLFVLLFFLFTPSVSALTKNETVYSKLDVDGSVSKTTVTNQLVSLKKEEIKDDSLLLNVLNISGKEKLEQEGRCLKWQSEGRDIFYKGDTEKSLEVDVKVTYFLDDKEEKYEDIKSKKGHVKIVYVFTNKNKQDVKVQGQNQKLYVPYLVSMGTMLDKKYVSNISISNGKTITTGMKELVVGLSLPGLYENFKLDSLEDLGKVTLEYDTTSFTGSTTYFAISPKALSELDPSILEKLKEVSTSIDKLDESMASIEKGMSTLSDSTPALTSGMYTLSESIKKLYNHMDSLKSGSTSLKEGITLLKDTFNTMTSSMDINMDDITALKSANDSGISKLATVNSSLEDSYQVVKDKTKEDIMALPISDAEKVNLITLKETYEGNYNLIVVLSLNNKMIDTLLPILKSLPESFTKVNAALTALEEGATKLEEGATLVKGGVWSLYEGSTKLSKATSSLEDGSKKLNTGVKKFHKEGIGTLVKYKNRINNYASKIEALMELSDEYSGFTSNNSSVTTFVYTISY